MSDDVSREGTIHNTGHIYCFLFHVKWVYVTSFNRLSASIMGKSCKVVVCGQWAVGKTAVLEQLLYANHVAGKYDTLKKGRKSLKKNCSVL